MKYGIVGKKHALYQDLIVIDRLRGVLITLVRVGYSGYRMKNDHRFALYCFLMESERKSCFG